MDDKMITITPKYSKDVLIIDRETVRKLEEERRNRPADYFDVIYDTPDIDLDWLWEND